MAIFNSYVRLLEGKRFLEGTFDKLILGKLGKASDQASARCLGLNSQTMIYSIVYSIHIDYMYSHRIV